MEKVHEYGDAQETKNEMELGGDFMCPLVLFFQALDQFMERNLRFQGELFNPILAIGLDFLLFLMPAFLFQTISRNTELETEQTCTLGRS